AYFIAELALYQSSHKQVARCFGIAIAVLRTGIGTFHAKAPFAFYFIYDYRSKTIAGRERHKLVFGYIFSFGNSIRITEVYFPIVCMQLHIGIGTPGKYMAARIVEIYQFVALLGSYYRVID